LRVAACLGAWLALPGLRGSLGGFARELAGLTAPVASEFSFLALPALPFEKKYKYVYISAISANLKENELHVGLKPKNTRVPCHDTPDKNEARGLKER
jgi:hypothetical protein